MGMSAGHFPAESRRPEKGGLAKIQNVCAFTSPDRLLSAIVSWPSDLGTWQLFDASPSVSGRGSLPRGRQVICFGRGCLSQARISSRVGVVVGVEHASILRPRR